MFTSAELIEALRRRMRRSLRPESPPGEFPPGWRDWFQAMAARPGRVSGANPEAFTAVLAAREPTMPAAIVERIGRWQAFRLLWRQERHPTGRDERGTRIVAMTGSLLVHLLFVLALAWLMFASFLFRGAPEAARDGEETVLQVEYIGEGTPVDQGGGAAEAQDPGPPAAAPAPPAAAAAPTPVPAEAPDRPRDTPGAPAPDPLPLPLPERPVVIQPPELALPPEVPAPQALQVTEVEVADPRFAVPPPRELPQVQARDPSVPEVAVREREVELRDASPTVAPRAPTVRLEPPALPAPDPRGVAVVERNVELVEAPSVSVRPAQVRLPEVTLPAGAAPAPPGRDIPLRTPAPSSEAGGRQQAGTGTASGRDPSADAGSARAPAAQGGRPQAGPGARDSGRDAGAGRVPGQPPGALPSTTASDDWGDSTRESPGRQAGRPGSAGLFNADGSPRLADGGRVGGGLPPGTVIEDFQNIDRHGTWLKRPPFDYEPTAFDRFWMPNESLLEEWVRRSVTEVRIPIPGTTKSIRCVTVLLAVGGACDIVDPNLQEQPAQARPPPDIPFKPELQEDPGALGPPQG